MVGTVCVSDPDLNPLYTADTHDPEWVYRQDVDLWLQAQGVDSRVCYRYEVYVIDTLCVRIFEHAVNEAGKCYINPETGDIAERQPYMIPVSTLPPTLQEMAKVGWPTPYRWDTP